MVKSSSFKTALLGGLYRGLLRPALFLVNPETVHNRFISLGEALGRTRLGRFLTKKAFYFQDTILEQHSNGLTFKNPVGLAAGFDKDGHLPNIIGAVGFGFAEIGSVTGEACSGNKGKRLWRLKKSRGLVVYYGLKNDGCEKIAERLASKGPFIIPIGISIAKTNNQQTISEETGIADYAKAYQTFIEQKIGDYFTINISCPNAFGGEPFTDPQKLRRLLEKITSIKKSYFSTAPLFLKIPATNDYQLLDDIIIIARQYGIAGFVCSNLLKDRKTNSLKEKNIPSVGGISGRPLADMSTDIISYLYKKTKGEFTIIGCGGISSAEDAYEKIKAGASLLQLITGMIYEGPQLIGDINRGLVKLLKKDGYKSISEAIGKNDK